MTRPPTQHRAAPHRARASREIRRGLRADRGSATTELVIATPLLLLMLMAIVQFALWSHATHIAQAAAAGGLAAARTHNGTTDIGNASAQRLLDQLGPAPLTHPSVACDRTADSVIVRVRGVASPVIPLLALPVHAEATGPIELYSEVGTPP